MEEDEDEIWDEKSLKNFERSQQNATLINRKSSCGAKAKDAKVQGTKSYKEKGSTSLSKAKQLKRKRKESCANTPRGKQHKSPDSNNVVTPRKAIAHMHGFCPKCQMPFGALIGQSPGWHVRECLEANYSYIGKL